jgi:branched-chain amino acid transport system permease protein
MLRIFSIIAVAALLVLLPAMVDAGMQNALTKMLIAALFATAFNLLAGQAGLLSFGHAAFFGAGAIVTLHLMSAIERHAITLPTPLLPLAGGLIGLLAGAVVGFFATKRSGVYFALVTVAISELVHSLAPHWESLFGGEAGLSSMRMPWAGISFGEPIEVYYLTLVWTVLSVAALWAYTRTPFGRLTLALRENEQRVRFLGYDTHKTKLIAFAISAAFTGIAGSLLALANESANYTLFAGTISAQVVLHAFIGGVTMFLGPMIGAAVLTLFGFIVSDLTRSWLLYQGLLFMIVMLYAPTGIAGIVAWHFNRRAELPWRRLLPLYLAGITGGVLVALGLIFFVESVHHLTSLAYQAARRAAGMRFPPYPLFGRSWDPAVISTWLPALLLCVSGGTVVAVVRRRVGRILADTEGEVEAAPAERVRPSAPPVRGANGSPTIFPVRTAEERKH